ncbi:hypothetical protein DENSPDRAFT_752588, partial [Dentipellis sp. KUC8613]
DGSQPAEGGPLGGGGSSGGKGPPGGGPPDRRNPPEERGPPGGNSPGGRPPRGPPRGSPPGGGGGGPPGGYGAYGPPFSDHSSSRGPRLKEELRPENLPSWDGDEDTAIQYFATIQELAEMGENLRSAMGRWLWTRLKDGSPIKEWYLMVSVELRRYMSQNYLNYLRAIRFHWLSENWAQRKQAEFGEMRFRQKGHADEKPIEFINRRIMYARMLMGTDGGGPEEVTTVLRAAPIAWHNILYAQSIVSTEDLITRIHNTSAQLLAAVEVHPSEALSSKELRYLKELARKEHRGYRPFRNRESSSKHGFQVTGETDEDVANSEDEEENKPAPEVFAAARQRPPPKDGYPYPKADHRRKEAKLVEESSLRSPEEEHVYSSAFEALLNENVASLYVDWEALESNPEASDKRPEVSREVFAANAPRVLVEEIEDEDDLAHQRKPKARVNALLEEVDRPLLDIVRLPRKRVSLPGRAAEGISVLSMKGSVLHSSDAPFDLRLDSCADISLMSEQCYLNLSNRPPLRQGMKLKLLQLTSKETRLKGYVQLPVFVRSKDGRILELETEVYVVSNMTVPLLLGEDFHQAYEITVSHSLEEGTLIQFGNSPHTVQACPVDRTKDHALVTRKTDSNLARFILAKSHRRNKARKRTEARKFGGDQRLVRVKTDVRILPNSVKQVPVESSFIDDRTWLVEKTMVVNSEDPVFAVPNTLITAASPVIPIANTSSRPKYLRKGDIVGQLVDPKGYLDMPRTSQELAALQDLATRA